MGRLDALLEVLDPDVVLRADGDTLAATGSRDVWGRPVLIDPATRDGSHVTDDGMVGLIGPLLAADAILATLRRQTEGCCFGFRKRESKLLIVATPQRHDAFYRS